MAKVVQTIERVEKKTTPGGKDVWEATLEDGTVVATLDEGVGPQLEEHEGLSARLDIATITKGKYTNHYVNSVEAADGGSQAASTSERKPTVRANTSATTKGRDLPDPTGERIARTSGLKMAVDIAIAEADGDAVVVDYDQARFFTHYIITGESSS